MPLSRDSHSQHNSSASACAPSCHKHISRLTFAFLAIFLATTLCACDARQGFGTTRSFEEERAANMALVAAAPVSPEQPEQPWVDMRPNSSYVLRMLFGTNVPKNIEPEIWATLDFTYRGTPHMVAFVALKPLDDQGKLQDCHACSPELAAVTFRKGGGIWRLSAIDRDLTKFGGWGKPPSSVKFIELPFGTDFGLTFESGGTGQGYTSVSRGVLRFDDAWQFLGYLQVSENNAGTSDCEQSKAKCWGWSGELKVDHSITNGVPDLVLDRKGTDSGGPVDNETPMAYAFDGNRYEERSKVAKVLAAKAAAERAAATAAAERAASIVSLAELRRLAATGMSTFKPYWVSTAINGNANFGDRLCDEVRYDGYCETRSENVMVQQDLASVAARQSLYDLRGRRGNTGCAKVEMRPDGQLYLTEFSPAPCK